MPEGVLGDGDLKRGLKRLERYADEPNLADLVERATPPIPGSLATAVNLANLRDLIDEVFGPDALPATSTLQEVWARAPNAPDLFASYLGSVVRDVRAGWSVRRAAFRWRLRRHRRRQAPTADAWARQFTRGPAWPP
jgi:hypothetical protein